MIDPINILIFSTIVTVSGLSHAIPPYFAGPSTTARGILQLHPATKRQGPTIFVLIYFIWRREKHTTGALYLNFASQSEW